MVSICNEPGPIIKLYPETSPSILDFGGKYHLALSATIVKDHVARMQ